MSDELPDDAIVGIAEEDYQFLQDYIKGRVTKQEFDARYLRPDGTYAIPVKIAEVSVPSFWSDLWRLLTFRRVKR